MLEVSCFFGNLIMEVIHLLFTEYFLIICSLLYFNHMLRSMKVLILLQSMKVLILLQCSVRWFPSDSLFSSFIYLFGEDDGYDEDDEDNEDATHIRWRRIVGRRSAPRLLFTDEDDGVMMKIQCNYDEATMQLWWRQWSYNAVIFHRLLRGQ